MNKNGYILVNLGQFGDKVPPPRQQENTKRNSKRALRKISPELKKTI